MMNETYLNESYLSSNVTFGPSCHYLMVDEIQPPDITVPLYGYALPILLVVTTTANTFVVAVLWQRHMRTPSNTILLAISLSDLFTLVVPAPMFFYLYTLGNHVFPIYPPIACYTYHFLCDVIPTLFHTASIWLTLALAAQRYIYVCHSPVARIFCAQPTVVKIVMLIFFAATLHQLPRFFEFVYEPGEIMYNGEVITVCIFCNSEWLQKIGRIYYPCYFWMRVVLVHLLPCALLVLINVLLYITLRDAQQTRRRLLQENRRCEYKKIREKNCTTMMLIVIVSVFLVTEIPLAIITFLHIVTNSGIMEVFTTEDYPKVHKFVTFSNFFMILFYPLNFAIYCGMSRQFRDTFKALFIIFTFFLYYFYFLLFEYKINLHLLNFAM